MLSYDPSRPFRTLFIDFNSYFASVEQQERPELRGRPVGVAAVLTDSSVLVAASAEAKRFGLSTGTSVFEARQACPEIVLVEPRHSVYVNYHERILKAVGSVRPIEKVCSVDEMWVHLTPSEADRDSATRIAKMIKHSLRTQVGECMTASIGLAPNPFLAKIATEIEKPDGLVALLPDELSVRLHGWKLTALPGINKRMAVRLNLAGIYTIADLLTADRTKLREAFGSVVGLRWWHLLRGALIHETETKRKSLSHSSVLPPELRNRNSSYQVLIRLIEKATARLRRERFYARSVTFTVRSRECFWEEHARFQPSRSTLAIIEMLKNAWPKNAIDDPTQVGVVLGDLRKSDYHTPSLFDQDNRRELLHDAVDTLNSKFGKHSVLPGAIAAVKDAASEKIAFQKTSLFSEGAGDNAA